MKASEQTIQQIERIVRKIGQKFPATDAPILLTDIHLRVSQESGELLAFDDDNTEITRCVVEEWIDNKEDDFYGKVAALLRQVLKRQSKVIYAYGILKPFHIVLEDDEMESVAEVFIADGDTVIITGALMEGLDQDLDSFFTDLMKDV